jgi:hypothetical protein
MTRATRKSKTPSVTPIPIPTFVPIARPFDEVDIVSCHGGVVKLE